MKTYDARPRCSCGCGRWTRRNPRTKKWNSYLRGHYLAQRNRTANYRGSANPNWKSGRFVVSHGHVVVHVGRDHPLAMPSAHGGGYTYEHRLVVSEQIGRWVGPKEEVHHIDGNRANNFPENLLVLNHSTHKRAEFLQAKLVESWDEISSRLFPSGKASPELANRVGAGPITS